MPTLSQRTEIFSRLLSTDEWIKSFCEACGYGYIANFDSVWKKPQLFYDDIHLNYKGKKILATNITRQLTTNGTT